MVAIIPATLVTSLYLLSAITNVLPSNPDSEMVQDVEADPQSSGRKSMDNGMDDRRPSLAVVSDRYSGGVKVLRPYFTGLGIIWREVATSTGTETIRIRDRGSFVEVTRISRNNRTVPSGNSYGLRPSGYGANGNGQTMGPQANGPYGRVPTSNVPSGNNVPSDKGPNVSVPDSRIKGGPVRTNDRGKGVTTPQIRNNQNKVGGTPPSTTGSKKISPDANLFSAIVNDFTFKMVKRMNIDSNFVVSPLSIFTALSMCYLGSGGRTKAQLEQILGLNEYAVHDVPLHHGISDLLSMISPDSNEYKLLMASGLFLGRDFTVEEPFLEEVKKFYAAELRYLDFSDRSTAQRTINDWVAKKTEDNIPTLIESSLPDDTRLVLLNAIFFKGKWKVPFPLDATYSGSFYSADGSEIMVPYMTMYRATFPYHQSEEHRHTFIKLPYQGDEVSMIIALPFDDKDIPMPFVTDQILCHVQDAMKDIQLGVVSVPRFRVEYLRSLKQPLERLGLRDLFGGSVNLTAMRKQNDVFVSEVLHKAVIDVHERGTTASAATDVQIVPLSGHGESFVANHPFAFYVVHDASGLVLFSGQVFDPLKNVQLTPKPSLDKGKESPQVPQNNRWVPSTGRRRV